MRIAITADPHFHNFVEFGRVVQLQEEGLPINSRLKDQIDNFWTIATKAKEADCKVLFINGDVFHLRGMVPTDVYQYVYQLFRRIVKKLGLQIVILTGNHDQSSKNGEIHAVYGMRDIATIVDKPQMVRWGKGADLYCVPYIADKDKLQRILDEAPEADMLCAHLGVDGAYVGPIEYKIKAPVTVDSLHPERYSYVLLGHYHKPQELAEGVYYVGSPAQINRGETGEQKRWMLYDSVTGKIESHDVLAKEFVTIEANRFLLGGLKHNYYDVLLGETTDLEAIQELATKYEVKLIPYKASKISKARLEVTESMTDAVLLQQYVEHVLESKKFSLYVDLGLQLLAKVEASSQNNARLSILRIVADNFLTIGHADLKCHRPGSVIALQGLNEKEGFTSNGAGKSSFLPESVYWCLWGCTARDVAVDKVVNRTVKRNCSVRIILLAGNTKVDVTRYRKHSKLGGDGIRLIVDGHDVTQGTPKLTQERLDKILGVDYTTFSSVITFSPDNLKFVSATDATQKHVLDSILQTRRFSSALAIAKQAVTNVKAAVAESVTELETKEGARESLEALATRYKELNESWEQRESERVHNLETAMNSLTIEWENAQKDLEALQARVEQLDAQVIEAQANKPDEDAIRGRMQLASQTLGHLRGQKEVKESQLEEVTELLDAALELAGKPCPTCGQEVANTGKLIANYQKRKGQLSKEIENLERSVVTATEHWNACVKENSGLQELRDKIKTMSDNGVILVRSVLAVESKVSRYKDVIADIIHQIEDKPVNDYDELIPETDHKIAVANAEIALVMKALKKQTLNLKRLNFWVNGFGPAGIRSFLLDLVIPSLTEYANQFSDKLSGGSIQIGFQTHKEAAATDKFTIQAWNAEGSDVYKGNSSGEKRRIDVCVLLGLFHVAYNRTRFNVLLLDEVLDTLDEAGIENIVDLLEDLAESLKLTIYVTSHNESLKSRIHEVITIVKKDGMSTLVEA